ncbi:MAG: uncharacterized protein A8A55_0816, partial [Amphiamblys sp. WSBS2006]
HQIVTHRIERIKNGHGDTEPVHRLVGYLLKTMQSKPSDYLVEGLPVETCFWLLEDLLKTHHTFFVSNKRLSLSLQDEVLVFICEKMQPETEMALFVKVWHLASIFLTHFFIECSKETRKIVGIMIKMLEHEGMLKKSFFLQTVHELLSKKEFLRFLDSGAENNRILFSSLLSTASQLCLREDTRELRVQDIEESGKAVAQIASEKNRKKALVTPPTQKTISSLFVRIFRDFVNTCHEILCSEQKTSGDFFRLTAETTFGFLDAATDTAQNPQTSQMFFTLLYRHFCLSLEYGVPAMHLAILFQKTEKIYKEPPAALPSLSALSALICICEKNSSDIGDRWKEALVVFDAVQSSPERKSFEASLKSIDALFPATRAVGADVLGQMLAAMESIPPTAFLVASLQELALANMDRLSTKEFEDTWLMIENTLVRGVESEDVSAKALETLSTVSNALSSKIAEKINTADTALHLRLTRPIQRIAGSTRGSVVVAALQTYENTIKILGCSIGEKWCAFLSVLAPVLARCRAQRQHSAQILASLFDCIQLVGLNFMPFFPEDALYAMAETLTQFVGACPDTSLALSALGLMIDCTNNFFGHIRKSGDKEDAQRRFAAVCTLLLPATADTRGEIRDSALQTVFKIHSNAEAAEPGLDWSVLFLQITQAVTVHTRAAVVFQIEKQAGERVEWKKTAFILLTEFAEVAAKSRTLQRNPETFEAVLEDFPPFLQTPDTEICTAVLALLRKIFLKTPTEEGIVAARWTVLCSICETNFKKNHFNEESLSVLLELVSSTFHLLDGKRRNTDTVLGMLKRIVSHPLSLKAKYRPSTPDGLAGIHKKMLEGVVALDNGTLDCRVKIISTLLGWSLLPKTLTKDLPLYTAFAKKSLELAAEVAFRWNKESSLAENNVFADMVGTLCAVVQHRPAQQPSKNEAHPPAFAPRWNTAVECFCKIAAFLVDEKIEAPGTWSAVYRFITFYMGETAAEKESGLLPSQDEDILFITFSIEKIFKNTKFLPSTATDVFLTALCAATETSHMPLYPPPHTMVAKWADTRPVRPKEGYREFCLRNLFVFAEHSAAVSAFLFGKACHTLTEYTALKRTHGHIPISQQRKREILSVVGKLFSLVSVLQKEQRKTVSTLLCRLTATTDTQIAAAARETLLLIEGTRHNTPLPRTHEEAASAEQKMVVLGHQVRRD